MSIEIRFEWYDVGSLSTCHCKRCYNVARLLGEIELHICGTYRRCLGKETKPPKV